MKLNLSRHRMLACFVHVIVGAMCASGASAQLENFVTARGDKLMDGDRELRFVSYNIPNLHYIEDQFAFTERNPWRIADTFEIRDALLSIRQAGGRVTRMYVPSIRKAIDDPGIVRHVEGAGVFNEEAFIAYDRILETANATGVRIIIPLVDNWTWWGGPSEYAALRGKTKEEFWTDSLVIADFKKTVAFIVNRVNTLTGIPYKNDKAILGWETGNELVCPYSWTRQMAAFIKSLDANHLVIEGTFNQEIQNDPLMDPNIDVLSTHHYTPAAESIPKIIRNRDKARGKKPYFVGEFGFIPTAEMRAVIDTCISSGISGIMVWSLRSHNRDGGFYSHTNAYRWPGFESGATWDEIPVVNMFRAKAYQINRVTPGTPAVPSMPTLLPIETPYAISWQGSAGASSYLIERKTMDDPTWRVIAPFASDANIVYRPLFADTTCAIGTPYLYRIRARNESGLSVPSDPVGPVTATYRMLIDEMEDATRFYATSEKPIFIDSRDLAKAKEDRSRLGGKTGEFIVYWVSGGIRSIQIDALSTRKDEYTDLQLTTGRTAETVSPRSAVKEVFEPLRNEYGLYTSVRYTAREIPSDHRFVRVVLSSDLQISRVEVKYDSGKQ